VKSKNLIPYDKIEKYVLIGSPVLLVTGLFWILIDKSDLIGMILFILGILSGVYLVLNRLDRILKFLKEIDWKSLGLKVYYILIIIGILILINAIANKRFWRQDFTFEGRFTLSGHTHNLLKEMDSSKKDVKMIFFRSESSLTSSVDDLLKEYKARCSVISLEFVDPDKEPVRAKQYSIRSISVNPYQQQHLYGTVIILSSGLKESIDVIKMSFRNVQGRSMPYPGLKENLEKDISSALLRLSKSKKKIYFVYGHGEVDLDDQQRNGWFETKKIISDENFLIDKVYLVSEGKVPADCDLLIVGAPEKNYLEKEYDIINEYFTNGGNLLVLLEPFSEMNINLFLNKWGIKTSKKFIVDPGSSYWFQPIIPLITEYNYHKITERLKYATFFPTAAPVEMMEKKPAGVTIEPLARTTSDSWIENDLTSKKVEFNKKEDKKGPVTIMAALTKRLDNEREAKMVVIGDSDFAGNSGIKEYGNMDLFLNTLNWLTGKEEMIGIRSKPVVRREIQLTAVKLKFVLYSCVVIFPLLIIIAGVVVWLRRR